MHTLRTIYCVVLCFHPELCDLKIAQIFQDWLHSLEIGTRFLDYENAQCNLKIAQISRLYRTHIYVRALKSLHNHVFIRPSGSHVIVLTHVVSWKSVAVN